MGFDLVAFSGGGGRAWALSWSPYCARVVVDGSAMLRAVGGHGCALAGPVLAALAGPVFVQGRGAPCRAEGALGIAGWGAERAGVREVGAGVVLCVDSMDRFASRTKRSYRSRAP